MRKILIGTTLLIFATANMAYAQSPTVPAPPKDNPRVEKEEKDKQKGNVENQNPQDTKAKEQAPNTKK